MKNIRWLIVCLCICVLFGCCSCGSRPSQRERDAEETEAAEEALEAAAEQTDEIAESSSANTEPETAAAVCLPDVDFVPTEEHEEVHFDDIAEDDWIKGTVDELIARNCISMINPSDEEGKFKPDDVISRVEFINMVLYALTGEKIEYLDGAWVSRTYEGLMQNGLLINIDFSDSAEQEQYMNGAMPRYEIAMFVFNCIALYKDESISLNSDPESNISHISDYDELEKTEYQEYKDYIIWAYNNGIIEGYKEDNSFRPGETVTRREAAEILLRIVLWEP